MRIIKKLHKANIGGKEKTLPNYFIEDDNGKTIMVKPVFPNDYPKLDFISVFVPNVKKVEE